MLIYEKAEVQMILKKRRINGKLCKVKVHKKTDGGSWEDKKRLERENHSPSQQLTVDKREIVHTKKISKAGENPALGTKTLYKKMEEKKTKRGLKIK